MNVGCAPSAGWMVKDLTRTASASCVVREPTASAPHVPSRISIVSPLCAARSAAASVGYCVVPICATAVAAGSVVPVISAMEPWPEKETAETLSSDVPSAMAASAAVPVAG